MACNSIQLRNIGADDCLANLGGVRRIWLALYDDDVFTIGTEGEDENVVTGVKEGTKWYTYAFRKDSASFNSTVNVSDNGSSFVQTTLTMAFPRMDSAKRAAVAALAKADLVGIVEDRNGNYWALGEYESLTDSGSTAETGAAKTDSNQYVVNLQTEGENFPLSVKPSVIESLQFGN